MMKQFLFKEEEENLPLLNRMFNQMLNRGEIIELFMEMDIVKNAESRFWAPVVASVQRSSTPDITPPSTSIRPTIATPSTSTTTSPPAPTEQIEDFCSP